MITRDIMIHANATEDLSDTRVLGNPGLGNLPFLPVPSPTASFSSRSEPPIRGKKRSRGSSESQFMSTLTHAAYSTIIPIILAHSKSIPEILGFARP